MRRDAFYASDLVNGAPEVDPKTSGLFGCVIDALKLYDFQGNLTDAAVGATNEDRVVGTTTYSMNGNGYVFGAHQTNPLSANPLRLDLVASDYEAGQEVGDLGLAAGKMKPTHQYQTLFVSAHLRDYKLAGGGVIANTGAADAYQIEGNSFMKVPILAGDASLGLNRSFTPVPHPVSGIIEPNQGFGSVIRVIDVDGPDAQGNSYLDLVVGAPTLGRVYIFWGDASIPGGVHPTLSKVTILDPPHASHNGFGGGFGNDIAAGDVDGDGKGDLLVGQPKWGVAPGALDRSGRAYLFRGAFITKPSGATMVVVHTGGSGLFEPPAPLVGTTGDFNFGWYLWMGDIDGDQELDLLIHAETARWPGTANGGVAVGTAASAAHVDRVGALYVWRNSSCTNPPFCATPDLQLFSPVPTFGWRFSKNLVFTKWWNAATQSEQPAVVISEPETERPMPFPTRPVVEAGTVGLYFLSEILYWGNGGAPLSLQPSWQLFNDFMDYPLLPAGPSPHDLFGRWMAAGHFGGGASANRAQLVVTASGHQVPSRHAPAIPVVKAGCGAHLEQGDP